MYPTKSQPNRAIFGARLLRFTPAALVAVTFSFAAAPSARASEAINGEHETALTLPNAISPKFGEAPPLLAEAETAAGGKKAAKGPKLNVDQKGVILKGYDPVAYFKQGKAVKGKEKISSTYGGATYYFASAEDKSEFDKNPAKYKPQYGGWCANGMLKGKLADTDPNEFFIYKGKLFVCTGAEQLKNFEAKPDENIKKADKKWERFQPPQIPGFLG
jgi:YHS domain-containing protein